jgi:hypothetical protein
MQFFLCEIVARIVAIYLAFDCSRTLRAGLVERKITYVMGRRDVLDWFLTSQPRWTFERDTAPIRYWMTVGAQGFTLLACIIVAICGWFHPNS